MGISVVAEEANYSTTFSPESGKDYAVTTAGVFSKVEANPRILHVTDKYGARVWHYRGELMTNRGFHQVVEARGKIYDLITGPNGMEAAKYWQMFAKETKVCPAIQAFPAGK